MVQIVLTCLRRHIMNYDIICPFDLSIDEVFTSEPLANGSCVALYLTEEEGKLALYRSDSESEEWEGCICAEGMLPVLRVLAAWAKCYARLNKGELAEVYGKTLSYLVSQIFTQGMLQRLMETYKVGSTIDLVEVMLNKGKLDWLQEL